METPPSQALPAILAASALLGARAEEICRLAAEIQGPGRQNKRSFQRLPKQERRRAQSHNPYRIPRRYRAGVLKEFETAAPKPSRRPRRDRRRNKRLLDLYRRRAESKGPHRGRWLPETHIWHGKQTTRRLRISLYPAKRFHMENLWGFRLPGTPCEKKKRQTYRHAARRATIHDRSD